MPPPIAVTVHGIANDHRYRPDCRIGEARRDRAQWILLLYAVVVIGGGTVLSALAMGEGDRVTRDLGLAAMSLVGVLL